MIAPLVVTREWEELVSSMSLEELEEGFLEIVEAHSSAYFRRWAARCAQVVRGLRQLELPIEGI